MAFGRGCHNALVHPNAGVGNLHAEVHGSTFILPPLGDGLPGCVVCHHGVAVGIYNAAVGG